MSLIFENPELNALFESLKKNKNVCNDNLCSICKDPLLIDTMTLSCKHRYHSECLQNSFVKYQSKQCPLCRDPIFWESYKSTCVITKRNGEICGKKCYNDERMCSLHVKSHLRALERQKDKAKNNNNKKIASKKRELKKLKEKIISIENEIKLLEISK